MASSVASSSALERLQWVESQYHAGRRTKVNITYNPENRSEKYTFHLDPWSMGAISSMDRPVLGNIINTLKLNITPSITTDKGHCSTSGTSVVSFWLKQNRQSVCQSTEDAATHFLSPRLSTAPSDYVAEELPPVPPPPMSSEISKLDQLLAEVQSIANQMLVVQSYALVSHQILEHNSQLCLNINTNTCLLYPLTQKLEQTQPADIIAQLDQNILRLDGKVTELIGDMDAEHSTLLSKLSELDVGLAESGKIVHRDHLVPTSQSHVAELTSASVQCPEQRMKMYRFKKSATFADSAVQVSPASMVENSTQITARAFYDEMSNSDPPVDSDVNVGMQTPTSPNLHAQHASTMPSQPSVFADMPSLVRSGHHPRASTSDTGGIRGDEASNPYSSMPSDIADVKNAIEESESDADDEPSDDEQYEPLPASLKRSSKYWQCRVYDNACGKGTVVDLLRNSNNDTTYYEISYDNGDSDRITRDEVKSLVAQYERLKRLAPTSREKATSSKSRHR